MDTPNSLSLVSFKCAKHAVIGNKVIGREMTDADQVAMLISNCSTAQTAECTGSDLTIIHQVARDIVAVPCSVAILRAAMTGV